MNKAKKQQARRRRRLVVYASLAGLAIAVGVMAFVQYGAPHFVVVKVVLPSDTVQERQSYSPRGSVDGERARESR